MSNTLFLLLGLVIVTMGSIKSSMYNSTKREIIIQTVVIDVVFIIIALLKMNNII